jgi:hypothetical protein
MNELQTPNNKKINKAKCMEENKGKNNKNWISHQPK